ncbi:MULTISPECIES: hypothetical protein [Butyricimonas]|uniref:hypothetical protein n=1 Tax=Butyricimonas TaxID=574697 RepID=UPI0007FB1DAC|nr:MULTISPECIES: hypothetical protein [Butyricimonas]
MKNKERKDEIESLNDQLYDEFYVQELEERLETDPLLVGGLLDFFSDVESDGSDLLRGCQEQCNNLCIGQCIGQKNN